MRLGFTTAAIIILAGSALAQEQQTQPCTPNANGSMRVGGLDPEMLRCQIVIISGMLGDKDVALSELRANVMLGTERLKAEVTAKAKLAAEYESRLDEAMKWVKAAQSPAAQMPEPAK